MDVICFLFLSAGVKTSLSILVVSSVISHRVKVFQFNLCHWKVTDPRVYVLSDRMLHMGG